MSKTKATKVIIKLKHPNCQRGIQYAEDIVSGKIASGRYMIAACERFLRDLDNEDAKFYFDADAAEKYLRSVQNFHHVEGHWATPQIKYEPWQCWVWMNIMGFKMKDTGFRRFRVVHLEVARGNAKAEYINTIVPTPEGPKRWGDIDVGSKLYDRKGNVCSVVAKNAVHFPQAYEIEFSDGEKTICSDKHLWFTQSKTERTRQRRHKGRELRQTKTLNTTYESVRETKDIANINYTKLKAGSLLRIFKYLSNNV